MSSTYPGFIIDTEGRAIIDKRVGADLVYGFNVTKVAPAGVTLASAVKLDAVGITADDPTVSGMVVSVGISGGTVGDAASVLLRWTYSDGQVDERTMHFNVIAS